MNSEEQKQIKTSKPRKKKVDFAHLAEVLWKNRKLFYIVLPIAFIVACIYAFSVPKVYKCEVMLAPELSTTRSSNTLSSLARSFGMRIGSNALGNGSEALLPNLYPDLMNSVDFKTSLFSIQVCAEDSVTPKSYYDYLLNDQKRPWWSAAIGGTIGAIKDMFAKEDTIDQSRVDPFVQWTRRPWLLPLMSQTKIL